MGLLSVLDRPTARVEGSGDVFGKPSVLAWCLTAEGAISDRVPTIEAAKRRRSTEEMAQRRLVEERARRETARVDKGGGTGGERDSLF